MKNLATAGVTGPAGRLLAALAASGAIPASESPESNGLAEDLWAIIVLFCLRYAQLEQTARLLGLSVSDLCELLLDPEALTQLTAPEQSAPAILQAGGLTIDPSSRICRVYGELIKLPLKEYDMLALLLEHVGKMVTREQISERLWGTPVPPSYNAMSVYLRKIRAKIQHSKCEIVTLPGVGFRLDPPPQPSVAV